MVAFARTKVILLPYSLCLLALPAQAGLPVHNQSVLALLSSVPILQPARLLRDEQQQISWNLTGSSQWVEQSDDDETIFLDGEAYVSELSWRFAWEKTEIQVLLPYISYRGGFTDGLIEGWHDLLDLPNADREKYPRNQLRFYYQSTHDEAELDSREQGVGDIRLSAGWQLQQTADFAQSIRVQMDMPTGDSDKWLGNGGMDLGVFLTQEWRYSQWLLEAQVGGLWVQRNQVLEEHHQPWAAFWSAAVSYQLYPRWWLVAQYDGNTSLYKNSDQGVLGDVHMISGGIQWQATDWQWHLALQEDLWTDSVADVALQLGLQYSY